MVVVNGKVSFAGDLSADRTASFLSGETLCVLSGFKSINTNDVAVMGFLFLCR
jgi:hypothetical protein